MSEAVTRRVLDGVRRMIDVTHTLSPDEQLLAALSVASMRLAMVDRGRRGEAVAQFKLALDAAMVQAGHVETLMGDPAGSA